MRFPRPPISARLAGALLARGAAAPAAGARRRRSVRRRDGAARRRGPVDLLRRATPPRRAASGRRRGCARRVPIEGPAAGATPRRSTRRLTSTSETIDDPTVPAYRVNGAIFISEGAGIGFGRCSGTSVVSPNKSVVITAGHCVYDEGIWSDRKWVFVPGYHHGERPFGTFTAHWLGTTPAWHAHENENFDVGAAVVGRNEKGQTLAAAVGADRLEDGALAEPDLRRLRLSGRKTVQRRHPAGLPRNELRGARLRLALRTGPARPGDQLRRQRRRLRRRLGDRRQRRQQRHHLRLSERPVHQLRSLLRFRRGEALREGEADQMRRAATGARDAA